MEIENGLYFQHKDECFLIGDLPEFSPGISRLVYMMEYVRRTTLDAVKGMTVEQLDTQVLEEGNTIGMLLAHITGIEESYQGVTFNNTRPSQGLPEHVLGESGRRVFSGHPLEWYLDRLASSRRRTLLELAQKDDDWLYKPYQPWGNKTWDNNFCWFHVIEDEIRHQGQIIILRKEIAHRLSTTS
ncbi:DinB family protein [Deinococcus planocerae]|uniref:DinB family protein n=1 Tax=Deinococcus planocerae TaxID=1737569 RepID=UPI000C7F3E69|nr:DinB family protein [Deinococcus planocerae]